MTQERRKKTPWYITALQNAIIPIIAVAAMAYLTLDRVEARLGNHIENKDTHMGYKEKLKEFVDRPAYNLHTVQMNQRLDKIDAMQMKIYDRLNERRGKR